MERVRHLLDSLYARNDIKYQRNGVVLLIWLLAVLLAVPVCAYTEEESYITQISSQPIKLKYGIRFSEDEMKSLISPEGAASKKLMDSVHDDLASGYRIADMDIDPKRIVLLLDTTVGSMIRIAQWDNEERAYSITDWPELPDVFLDTYHDGEAVFLNGLMNHLLTADLLLW